MFASFDGSHSPLRHRSALASCRWGEHALWWTVDAASASDALALLPFCVAARATARPVADVPIP